MEYATLVLTMGTSWLQGHMTAVSAAITTTLLVIFGDDINRFVKNRVRRYNFLIRTATFVVLCAFGYGLLSVAMVPAVSALLGNFPDKYLVVVVPAAFLLMGMLAERKKYL